MKTCSRCKEVKCESGFYKSTKCGLQSHCKECTRITTDKSRITHPYDNKKYAERKAKWALENKDRVREVHRAGAARRSLDKDYVEKLREKHKAYKRENTDKVNADGAKRRAMKLKSSPAFASKQFIQEIYTKAKVLTETTGIEHHVDHIVPLRSKLVCGLHWEGNLQILTAEENIKKSNKIWPDMP
jgi:flagellum-specific peptidoglycan hydrolase FlgJ